MSPIPRSSLVAQTPPTVGQPAPDFTLPSTSGDTVTLSSYRGRDNLLLAFFPLAFTGTCTSEMCSFTEDLSRFEQAGTRVFGISVDSIPTLKEFAARHGIGVELLSDFKREVSRLYGTLLEDHFFSSRSYFIVDREGVLRWSFTEDELGHRRDDQELLDQLAALV